MRLSCEGRRGSQHRLVTCTAMQRLSTQLGAGSCRMQAAQRQERGQGQQAMAQAPAAVAA